MHRQWALHAGKLTQHAIGTVIAGMQRKDGGALVITQCKTALQLRLNGFDMRCQACLGLALSEQQALAKRAELGGMTLAPQNDFAAQLVLPLFQGAPHMAVGKP